MSSIASSPSWTLERVRAWPVAALLAFGYLLYTPPSADLAAQYYRADLGLVLWDNGWYGGHHMPGYSVLFPPLAALLGPRLVGALSAVAAAWLFERLVRGSEGERIAALWFAAGSVTTLISGRLTFALGVAIALGAVLAAARGRVAWACVLGALASLASPVAGAFVALAAAAWCLERRRAWPIALAFCAVAPAALLAVAFPEGGSFPFVPSSFWPALAAALAVLLALPRDARLLRIGTGLYALGMIASFALSTPMGGNVVRLGALFAGPMLAAVLWRRNRLVLALLALPLLYWQWVAPVDDWARSAGDPSVHERFYTGLLGFLGTRDGGPFRIEIPFTDNHWESRWVAPHFPLARGWERQVDRARNAIFYDGRPITPASYRRWLDDNAVRFVALADAPIDYSAAREAQIVRDGQPYLRPVWHDAHWRVYEVVRARPLAGGAARATALGGRSVRLRAQRPGIVDLRVRFTPYWRLAAGRGCVSQAPGDWTRVRVDAPGTVELRTSFALGRIRASSPRCSA
ncbi:MAG TPA: hypothetical protein VH834_17315 [Solirubrobacteraceae bacterium]